MAHENAVDGNGRLEEESKEEEEQEKRRKELPARKEALQREKTSQRSTPSPRRMRYNLGGRLNRWEWLPTSIFVNTNLGSLAEGLQRLPQVLIPLTLSCSQKRRHYPRVPDFPQSPGCRRADILILILKGLTQGRNSSGVLALP